MLNSSTAREPSSSLRWRSMSLRMYAASSAPRLSRMLLADGVELDADLLDVGLGEVGDRALRLLLDRGHVSLLRWVRRSVVEVAGAGGGVDAGLDLDRAGLAGDRGGDLAVAQVAHRAFVIGSTQPMQMPMRHPLGIRTPAASAASRIGVAPSSSSVVPLAKATVPPSPGSTRAVRNCSVTSSRPAASWWASRASSSPAGPHARVRRSARSGTRSARSATSRTPCTSSYRATRRIAPAASRACRSRQEDRVGLAGRDVDDDDVEVLAAVEAEDAGVGAREEVAQHPDDRGDAGAGGDEEQPVVVGGEHELAGRLLEVDERAGHGLVDEVVADQAVRHGLDRDRDAAVGARAVGQRVGAPLADAVDVDADAEVLTRLVAGPVGAGADDDGGGVGGLGVDLLDPAAEVGAGAQRGEEVEEVGGHERRGGGLGQPRQARSAAIGRAAARASVKCSCVPQCPSRRRSSCPVHVNRGYTLVRTNNNHGWECRDSSRCARRHTTTRRRRPR